MRTQQSRAYNTHKLTHRDEGCIVVFRKINQIMLNGEAELLNYVEIQAAVYISATIWTVFYLLADRLGGNSYGSETLKCMQIIYMQYSCL